MTTTYSREHYQEIGRKGGLAVAAKYTRAQRAIWANPRQPARRPAPSGGTEPSGPTWERIKARWCTVAQACALVGCSQPTIKELARHGTIRQVQIDPDKLNLPSTRHGYRVLVDRRQVMAYAAHYQAWTARFRDEA